MGGLSCHMRRQKSTRVLGSGPLCGRGAIDILKTSNEAFNNSYDCKSKHSKCAYRAIDIFKTSNEAFNRL